MLCCCCVIAFNFTCCSTYTAVLLTRLEVEKSLDLACRERYVCTLMIHGFRLSRTTNKRAKLGKQKKNFSSDALSAPIFSCRYTLTFNYFSRVQWSWKLEKNSKQVTMISEVYLSVTSNIPVIFSSTLSLRLSSCNVTQLSLLLHYFSWHTTTTTVHQLLGNSCYKLAALSYATASRCWLSCGSFSDLLMI